VFTNPNPHDQMIPDIDESPAHQLCDEFWQAQAVFQ
jgi:hypothetical protein